MAGSRHGEQAKTDPPYGLASLIGRVPPLPILM